MTRYYKIPENLLLGLVTDSIELTYLREFGVDNWHGYCDAISIGIDEWLDQHHDVTNIWDEDDPRREDFFIDDVAQAEIDTYYKKYLIGEDE